MNFYRVAMRIFKEHKKEFIEISLKRDKLKTMINNERYFQRKYGTSLDYNEKIKELRKEIKERIEKINNLIGGLLK